MDIDYRWVVDEVTDGYRWVSYAGRRNCHVVPALPAPVPQPVPFPIIVHHNNQYQPAAIMNAGDSLERVDRIDRMEKYRT